MSSLTEANLRALPFTRSFEREILVSAIRPGCGGSRRHVDPPLHLDVDLGLVPEDMQRRLYNAFGLEVRYSRPREELTLRVMVPGFLVKGPVSVTHELGP
ncbi:hypothetical protein ABZ619_22130 [Streptomyces sp. NPDC007851]|uniref:hypothetical protein n=1 Tax=Streptomyces sp. NPDC007851 TaxID=3155008 RepID=UPI0033D4C264